jgi:hypothetical protein
MASGSSVTLPCRRVRRTPGPATSGAPQPDASASGAPWVSPRREHPSADGNIRDGGREPDAKASYLFSDCFLRLCGSAIYRAKCGPNCPPPIAPSVASKHSVEVEALVTIRRDSRDKSRCHMVWKKCRQTHTKRPVEGPSADRPAGGKRPADGLRPTNEERGA